MSSVRSALLLCALPLATAIAEPTGSGNPDAGHRDAVIILVNEAGNPGLAKISFSTLRKVFSCQINNWRQVPGSKRTDAILPFRPDESSTAMKIFRKRIGNVAFGPCVTSISGPNSEEIIASGMGRVPPTANVKEISQGIGFLGWRVPKEGSRALQVGNDNRTPAGPFVAPDQAEILKGRYPLTAP